ncbi:MAG: Zn-dependent alcohol dehydrogenase [Acidimicrobiales bacterium]|nr:Zn-dependent alcohol dehydrogenase [Acidimicrobiales bacterium]MDG2906626.1 Zn-dependent alcohol dehydrogenase [Acidimicrobiales bacterium]
MLAAILMETPTEELMVADDVTLRDLAPGDVKVKIAHSGVCHSDLSAMNGTIPQTPPAVLGHEGAGVVTDIGDGVTHVAPGDHVIIAFSPPCGTCPYCTGRGQPNLCIDGFFAMSANPQFRRGDTVVGAMTGCGTFAEETIVPGIAAIKIDDDIPLDVAALVGCGVTTGVGAALNTAGITPGSSVLVIGAGGVGVAAIQGARIAGAAVIVAVDLHEGKLDRAKAFGATHGVLPDDLPAALAEITAGEGFDFTLECIGMPTTMRQAFDMTRRGGTSCIVGVGRMDETFALSAFEMFFSEKTLVGSMYGGADVRTDFNRFLRLYKAGRLDLEGMISRRIHIDEVNDAMACIGDADIIRQVIDF